MAWNGTTRERYRRNAERYESDLTDGEWSLVEPLPPPPSQLDRPRSTDLREVFNAIRYMLAAGCRWRAVPRCSAPFTTVQDCFHPWRGSGVLERMTDAPRGLARDRAGRDPEPTAAGTGSQPVRTTETAGPSGYGAGRKARGRRRHIAVDVEGNPIVIQAHTADARDRDGAPEVILEMPGKHPCLESSPDPAFFPFFPGSVSGCPGPFHSVPHRRRRPGAPKRPPGRPRPA